MMSFRKFIRARDWRKFERGGMTSALFERYGEDLNNTTFERFMNSGDFGKKKYGRLIHEDWKPTPMTGERLEEYNRRWEDLTYDAAQRMGISYEDALRTQVVPYDPNIHHPVRAAKALIKGQTNWKEIRDYNK